MKRLVTLAALLLLLVPLLIACGQSADTGAGATSTSTQRPTDAPDTAATAGPTTGSSPTTQASPTDAQVPGSTAVATGGPTIGLSPTPQTSPTGAQGPGSTAVATGSPAATGEKVITIGSKDFTEQFILAELYAQALEAKGYKVNRQLNLGGVAIVDKALASGQIDVYPEYTGTALETIVKYKGEQLPSPEETYRLVKDFYAKRTPSLTVLPAAAFENTYGIAVRKEAADKYGLKTLADLEKASPNLRLASFGEFQNRSDGLPNIKENYPGMNFKDTILVNDLGLRYKALQEGQADVGIGFTTDPQLLDEGLVVMEDPKQIWPPYYPAPVVRAEYLQTHPDVEEILNSVTAKLSSADVMRELNRQAVQDEEEPKDIAARFLKENGLQ